MDTMNRVFHDYLDQFIVVFIDDILIYSKSKKEHRVHLWKALERLRHKQLYIKLKKCEFWLDRVSFLGHMISRKWVSVYPEKVKEVVEWERPTSVHKIQSFIGLVGYYRRFIEGFSKLSRLLTGLTKKNARYLWTNNCEEIFLQLKRWLVSALTLTLPIDSENFVVYSDASNKGLGCVLMQNGKVIWYALHSCKSYK